MFDKYRKVQISVTILSYDIASRNFRVKTESQIGLYVIKIFFRYVFPRI